MSKNAELSNGEYLEFILRRDDPVLGISEFEISVVSINGHTLTLEKYSETQQDWYLTGDDDLTAVGISIGRSVTGGRYRLVCAGGTGTCSIEISS